MVKSGLDKDINEIKICVVRIEEHLNNINGKIISNEKRIDELEKDVRNNMMSLSKLAGMGIISAIFGSFIGGLIMLILQRV